MITSATTLKDLSILKEKGLKILAENLTPVELINFIRLFSNGEGDFTKERQNMDITREEFLAYAKQKGEL
ncbi:MAG: hypothetical protein FWF46_04525 [Oscillospiraceae bacterium]|nr:hypothetical protein [Oscillospiraceae bacterium]